MAGRKTSDLGIIVAGSLDPGHYMHVYLPGEPVVADRDQRISIADLETYLLGASPSLNLVAGLDMGSDPVAGSLFSDVNYASFVGVQDSGTPIISMFQTDLSNGATGSVYLDHLNWGLNISDGGINGYSSGDAVNMAAGFRQYNLTDPVNTIQEQYVVGVFQPYYQITVSDSVNTFGMYMNNTRWTAESTGLQGLQLTNDDLGYLGALPFAGEKAFTGTESGYNGLMNVGGSVSALIVARNIATDDHGEIDVNSTQVTVKFVDGNSGGAYGKTDWFDYQVLHQVMTGSSGATGSSEINIAATGASNFISINSGDGVNEYAEFYINGLTSTALIQSDNGVNGTTVQVNAAGVYMATDYAAQTMFYDVNGNLRFTGLHNNSTTAGNASQQDIRSGSDTVTPGTFAVANVSGISSITKHKYLRVGNEVVGSFRCEVDITVALLNTQFTFDLPVPSDIAAFDDVSGVIAAGSGGVAGEIFGIPAGNNAKCSFTPTGSGLIPVTIFYQYTIK